MKTVRILLISDTHNAPFDRSSSHPFHDPLPTCDILIHAGDLTNIGGISEYKDTLQMLKKIKAELKLVIAGNHDLTLDREYVNRSKSQQIPEETKEEAEQLWKGHVAKEAGVTFLDEGLHHFRLRSGAKFSLYASPYTPEFCNWAFAYERHQDRWNAPYQSHGHDTVNIARNPIPSFPKVDIVLTHGPPQHHLGKCWNEFDAGCHHLMHALKRARPRLHCFGHIHEAWGAERISWNKEGSERIDWNPDGSESYTTETIEPDRDNAKTDRCVYVNMSSSSDTPLEHGKSTVLVNAAIMDLKYKPANPPWLIDMDLPSSASLSSFSHSLRKSST